MPREVPLCSVIHCPNSDRRKVGTTVFYFVPTDRLRADKWAKVLKEHIYDVIPALTKMLICINHFTPDAFEINSKKLKIDAFPSIFPSSTRPQNSELKRLVKNEIIELPSKKLNVKSVTSTFVAKETGKRNGHRDINDQISQKCIIPDVKSGNGSQISVSSQVKDKSSLPGLQIRSVLLTNQGSRVNSESGHMEERVPNIIASGISLSEFQMEKVKLVSEKSKIQKEAAKINMEINVSSSSRSGLKIESETDEKSDIKQENLEFQSATSSEDEDICADIYKGQNFTEFENVCQLKEIKRLKLLKQNLSEECEKLQKRDQELGVELNEVRKVIYRRKTKKQNAPKQEIDILKKCFSTAQIRLLTGQYKCRWSLDDLAVAYTISSLSSREFYLYLRTNLKYPLPAVSNINRCYKSKYRKQNEKNNE